MSLPEDTFWHYENLHTYEHLRDLAHELEQIAMAHPEANLTDQEFLDLSRGLDNMLRPPGAR